MRSSFFPLHHPSALVALLLLLFCMNAAAFGPLCDAGKKKSAQEYSFPASTTQVPPNLKVAFIGDAGSNENQAAVLNQIKAFGAAFVVHSGDFEYENDPQLFEDNINAVLGPDYPYFASIGNHDLIAWSGHKKRLEARLERMGAGKNCTGDVGVKMTCHWQGMYLVFSGVGVWGLEHPEYLDAAFSSSDAIWKVSSWHKNQRQMQIGGKFNGVGWDVYETSRKHGAIVATGHEHSFCRSYMMSSFSNQVVANFNETLNMKIGESFVFVSGLGGKSVREWNDRLIKNEWWAAYGASDNDITHSSLLCTFHIDNNPRKAHCSFIDINGKVWDDFDLYTELPDTMEGLKASLANHEKANPRCRNDWVEVPVSRDSADVIEDAETGELTCGGSSLSFKNKAVASLRFDKVPLKKGARVKNAFLQVYSSESDDQPQRFVITGSKGQVPKCGQGLLRHQVSRAQTTRSAVVWDEEEEGWELNTVWVSNNLKTIVNEFINADDWEEGNAITLNVAGKGNVAFFSYDYDPCFAPTLAIELEEEC